MTSIFTRIINGEIPCHKVAESEDYFAFLDIAPLTKGHTLVVPKQEIDQYFDLDDNQITGLTLFSKKIAKALKETVPCKRVGVIVAGLEVPHAHVHLVPIQSEGDLSFSKIRVEITQEELATLALEIGNKV